MTGRETSGRKPKSEEIKTERRRRSGSLGGLTSKLSLPEQLKDDKENVYRWFNDVNNNVHDHMTNDDWDLVSSKNYTTSNDMGASVSKRVGTGKDGKPLVAYLMKKPVKYSLEDKQEGQKAIDEKMNRLRSGAQVVGNGELDNRAYVPKEGIKLR